MSHLLPQNKLSVSRMKYHSYINISLYENVTTFTVSTKLPYIRWSIGFGRTNKTLNFSVGKSQTKYKMLGWIIYKIPITPGSHIHYHNQCQGISNLTMQFTFMWPWSQLLRWNLLSLQSNVFGFCIFFAQTFDLEFIIFSTVTFILMSNKKDSR